MRPNAETFVPAGLPACACGLGTKDWLTGRGPDGNNLPSWENWTEAGRALDRRRQAGILLVDGTRPESLANLIRWIPRIAALRQGTPPVLTVLVGGDPAPDVLARLLRAGVFDYLPAQADPAVWQEVITEAEAHLSRLVDEYELHAETAATQEFLIAQKQSLRRETEREAHDLFQAQADLEAANERLAEHMEQLALLYKFGRELSVAKNWDDTLRGFLQNLAEFVGAVGAALILRSAPGGAYAPRQTYRWDESAWDKVLLNLTRQVDGQIAESLLAPGVFRIGRDGPAAGGRIMALPLEQQGLRLGFLLLLFASEPERERRAPAVLPFLQMVQVVLSEEVAGAQMLDRLREIGSFNARVLETVRSAIWVCDAEGRTIYLNGSARRLLGDEGPEVPEGVTDMFAIGRGRSPDQPPLTGRARADLPEIFLDGCLQLDGEPGPAFPHLYGIGLSFHGEACIATATDRRIPVLIRANPMPGRWQQEQWLLVVAEDLTEARRAEAARLRADRLQGLVEMSATLAHEIRNPLMGLSAQAELLSGQIDDGDGRRRYLDVITREVDRIDDTITRMLQFTRPYTPRREPTDLVTLARDCLTLAEQRAVPRGIDLDLDDRGLASSHRLLDVDPAQIKQVLLNLVFNGIDAAPDGGRVQVGLRSATDLAVADPTTGIDRISDGVEITVDDDGPGFATDDRDKLFQPFFTTKSSGTGLGLAISRKVVTAHGGEIRAERDGNQTRMRVVLPGMSAVGSHRPAKEAT